MVCAQFAFHTHIDSSRQAGQMIRNMLNPEMRVRNIAIVSVAVNVAPAAAAVPTT